MWIVSYCMEGNYKHRVVDALLERKLLGKGAVLVEEEKDEYRGSKHDLPQ